MTIVTLTTDFGLVDPFVGIMKGVIASRAPVARIVDVTHGIPPQDVLAGALALRHAAPYFPPRTVHVAVVDPGVGSARRPICVETTSAFFVGPDNGVLSLAAPADTTRRIIHLTDERFFLEPRSATFHGRDVFAPVAAALAVGTAPAALGAEVAEMVRLAPPVPAVEPRRIRGEVIYVDGFGNLVTNVDAPTLARCPARSVVVRGTRTGGVQRSYAAVAHGEPVAVVNSWGLLEIAVRDGSAAKQLSAGVGEPVTVEAE
jgi:S-adenosylmethionine hydrolase